MSKGIEVDDPPARKAAGIIGHLFGRSEHKTPGLDLDDIQGFILRGYRMPMVRHFLLTVGVPVEARKLLGWLVSGDDADALQITTRRDRVGRITRNGRCSPPPLTSAAAAKALTSLALTSGY